jgi:hypothetical protein
MGKTVAIHCAFVTAKLAGFGSIAREDVLHCDKVSWFRHNQASPAGLVALDDFGLAPFRVAMV